MTKEIAIDLGTANTIIIHNDKIVINEPSIVALDARTDKLIAVGKEAHQMEGKGHPGIRTVRPLRKGVIADFNAAELMIRGLVKKASTKNNWFSPSLRMVVGIPSGSTEVEVRAPAYVNGVSEALFATGICLPAGPYVTDDDVRYIVDTIKSSIDRD